MRVALLVAVVACVDRAPPIEPMVTSHTERMRFIPRTATKLDLLFVIDSSTAMAAQRTHLDAELPSLMTALESFPDGLPDLHVGVITANDEGQMIGRGNMTGAYLSDAPDINGTRTRNYTGTLADAFRVYADVGASSTRPTRPFETVERVSAVPDNAGFSRRDAVLVIVHVSATDDMSAVTVADHAATLKARGLDPTRVAVSTITGPATGASPCGATAAPRLHALLDALPNRSAYTSICDDDLSPAIALAVPLIKTSLGIACWERAPMEPHDCSASIGVDVYGAPSTAFLPACTTADPGEPCWRIADEPFCDGGAKTTRLEPLRTTWPQGTWGEIECVVAPSAGNP